MEKTLEVTPCELSRILPFLVQATRPKSDTSGGLATVQDVCKHAQSFVVTDEGHDVGGYVVEPLEFDRGVCLWVTMGAGQVDGLDLTATMEKIVEVQARQIGASQIGMITKRRGLIKKLQANGWAVAGIKMLKKL